MSRLSFKVWLKLLSTGAGGRARPISSGYHPNWNLETSWLGQPSLHGGRVMLDGISEIVAGGEGAAVVEPLLEDGWGAVDVGSAITMQEGSRIVGHATVLGVTRPDYFTRETAAFADQARQYCAVIVSGSTLALSERLETVRTRLLALYSAGSCLPLVDALGAIEAGPNPERPDGWADFGEFEFYWEVFDPYVNETPVSGSLSDDVLDIYFDVKRGLELWTSGARAAAVWEWRFHFETHWGDHATDALRALHRSTLGRMAKKL